jgi:molybdate transport system permease protein
MPTPRSAPHRAGPDWPFFVAFSLLGGIYVLLILAMLLADLSYTTPDHLLAALASPEIRYSIRLSLISCTITTILALWAAVPLGYLLSRTNFYGKTIIDTIVDVPIVVPPVIVGLSLLILFQTIPGRFIERYVTVTYAVPGVIVAQFAVATAFAARTMRVTFDQIPARSEQVAMTLGCGRGQAFWYVTFPEARRGLLTAATLTWAKSLGEFGPILIFCGATRLKTEVLSTTVYLELNNGQIGAAIGVSLLMVAVAVTVLVVMRLFGQRGIGPI